MLPNIGLKKLRIEASKGVLVSVNICCLLLINVFFTDSIALYPKVFAFEHWVMTVIADFMLVYLPAPTVPLRSPIAMHAGSIAEFFHNCPDNAFQVGTAVTNAFLSAKKDVDKTSADEVENVHVLSTSVAYGVYMAFSSNLRCQIVTGVVEHRIL